MAKRYAKDNRPQVEKVKRVELDTSHLKQKLIIAGILLIIGLGAIGYGIYNSLKVDPGYEVIEVGSNFDTNNSAEFTLLSYVEDSAYKKNLIKVYSNAQVEAYRLFNVYEEYEHNLCYINTHPNEDIEIDKKLYNALKVADDYRYIYLGPIYQIYNGVFSCDLDGQIESYIPELNEEVKKNFEELSNYISNSENVYIEFKDNNKIKLVLSDEYLNYLRDNGLDQIVDFYYMNNACIMDYVCDVLLENGYERSIISSCEGYMRLLDNSSCNYNLFGLINNELALAGKINCDGPISIIEIRNFILNDNDAYNYYQTADGKVYSKYLDFNGANLKPYDNLLTYRNCSSLNLILDTMDLYFGKDISIDNISIIGNIIENNGSVEIKDLESEFSFK